MCPGRQAGEVGARAGLGIALRPDHGARNDGRQMLRLLCGGPELHEDGADMIETLSGQMRAISSGMMSCSLSVAPILPYCLGQWGAIQPLRESVRYEGMSSAGGGRVVRPRSASGRLASSQVRTSMRNWASTGVSRRNMARKVFDADAGERYRAEGRKTHSTLMLAAFTTAVHCASSLASNLPNSAGVPILISAPSVASRARVSGWARLSRNAALSLSMIAGGVPAGATTPSQNGACSLG